MELPADSCHQEGGLSKFVPVQVVPTTPFLHIFAPLSPVFIHRLFRDPKKRLMGVHIRMRLSQKRTVPHRLDDIRLV